MSKDSSASYERRMYPRVDMMGVDISADKQKPVRIIDISARGAQVEFPTPLTPGQLYEMQLTFPDRQIRTRVRVTRCLHSGGAGEAADGRQPKGFLAGLEFVGLDSGDQRYLEGYVAGQSELKK